MDASPPPDECPVLWCEPVVRQRERRWYEDDWDDGGEPVERTHYPISAGIAQQHGTAILTATFNCRDTSHEGAHKTIVADALTHPVWPLTCVDWDGAIAWGGLTAADWSRLLIPIRIRHGIGQVESVLSRLDANMAVAVGRHWAKTAEAPSTVSPNRPAAPCSQLCDYVMFEDGDGAVLDALCRVWAARGLSPLQFDIPQLTYRPFVPYDCAGLNRLIDAGFVAPLPATRVELGLEDVCKLDREGSDAEALLAWWHMCALLPDQTDQAVVHDARRMWHTCVRMLAWQGQPPGDVMTWVTAMDARAGAAHVAGWETAVVRYLRDRPSWLGTAFHRLTEGHNEPDPNKLHARTEAWKRVWMWGPHAPTNGAWWPAACAAMEAQDEATARAVSWLKRSALVGLRAALRVQATPAGEDGA